MKSKILSYKFVWIHLRPYYSDEDDTDGLYHSEAKT